MRSLAGRHTLVVLLAAAGGVGCSRAAQDPRGASSAGQPATVTAGAGLPREKLTRPDRERWRAVLGWPEACESAYQSSQASDDPGLQFHPLAPGISLVQVLCAAGSYQPSWVYLRFDERASPPAIDLLRFPAYETEDGTTVAAVERSEVWGEPSWSAATQELSLLNIVRQTGDCGIWTRYRLSADEAAAGPLVVEARALLPCPARPADPAVSIEGQPPPGWTPIVRTAAKAP
jgi:hypothetical protein